MAVARPSDASNRPVILIGFAEAMAAIEAAWSLQQAGFHVVAFRRAGSRPAVRHVRGLKTHQVPAPESDTDGAIAGVRKLCHSVRPSAVLPLDDSAVWVCRQLDGLDIPVAGAERSAAACALDKGVQLQLAAEAGLSVPRTRLLSNFAEGEPPSFPVMVKPALALYEVSGALRRPTGMMCGNLEEFTRARAKPWPGTMLVQPLIRGIGEGLFGHMGAHGVVGWSAHRRVRMVNPQGSASSACQSQQVDENLIGPAESFLRAIGWRGLFMLEFLRDDAGTPWFMELNGRAWGSMALARRRGFEYPAWTVRGALDPAFEPVLPTSPPDMRCRNLGLELVRLAFVARGPQSEASVGWPSMGRAVRDICAFRKNDRLYNWNRSQPRVLMADVAGTLWSYGRKMIGRR
jgi:predicted ATP-grasp superfamily ATP-dependent carboligase